MPRPQSINGQLHHFPVYLKRRGERRWWAIVRVFSSRRAMWKYSRSEYNDKSKAYRAVFYDLAAYDKKATRSKCIGEILFSINDLPHELVAHECAHAAMAWWRVTSGMASNADITLIQDEEQFVTALGKIANSVEAQVSRLRPMSDAGED